VIPAVMATVVLAAAFIKGAIGFGFPSLATPLLSLFVDVKTAVPARPSQTTRNQNPAKDQRSAPEP
jgi:uncharacterized membrane protein YfcA